MAKYIKTFVGNFVYIITPLWVCENQQPSSQTCPLNSKLDLIFIHFAALFSQAIPFCKQHSMFLINMYEARMLPDQFKRMGCAADIVMLLLLPKVCSIFLFKLNFTHWIHVLIKALSSFKKENSVANADLILLSPIFQDTDL